MMVSVVPFHIGTFPLFLGPVSKTFGWGRAEFALSVTISGLFAAVAAPLVGRIVDRLGARTVLLPAVVIYALATMAQSQLTTSKLQFYLTYSVLGASEAIAGPVAFAHLISSWYQTKRGLMLSLVIGAAPTVSLMIMAPVTQVLIEHYGWRTTYIILGVTILALALPAFAFLIHDPAVESEARSAAPQIGRSARAERFTLPGLALGRVFVTATFWMVLAALVIHSLVINGVRAHSVELMTGRGIPIIAATLSLSVYAFAGLAGNVSSGILLDRVASPRVAAPFFLAALVGLVVLGVARSTAVAFAGMAILGFGIGAESGIGPYYLSRYFGLRSFGTLYGCLVSLLAIGSGVGPYLLGRSFDATGSYARGLTMSQIGLGIGIVLILLLGPYVYDARLRETPRTAEAADSKGAMEG
jgi:MFS family permease